MSFLESNLFYPSEKCLITNLKDFQYEYEPERNDPKSNHQIRTNFSIFCISVPLSLNENCVKRFSVTKLSNKPSLKRSGKT